MRLCVRPKIECLLCTCTGGSPTLALPLHDPFPAIFPASKRLGSMPEDTAMRVVIQSTGLPVGFRRNEVDLLYDRYVAYSKFSAL